MSEEKKISASDFINAIKSTTKLTGADILNNLMTDGGNLHMKSDISDPLAYTAMHVKANWLSESGYKSTAQRYRDIANFAEQFSVGKKGKRAGMIAEAVVSVMVQEHEIEKSKAKMLMGR